jgi:uncharacterized membrane protein
MTMDERRQVAIGRLKAKRDFRSHLAIYLVVNTMLVVIWAVTGAGYFWPIWPIAGWGVGLAFNAFNVFFQKPITEEDIQAEIGRDGPQDTLGS